MAVLILISNITRDFTWRLHYICTSNVGMYQIYWYLELTSDIYGPLGCFEHSFKMFNFPRISMSLKDLVEKTNILMKTIFIF